MPPTINEFMKKLNANEKMVVYGAVITIVGALLSFGGQYGSFGLIAAVGAVVVYWLKYSPNQITWPAPVPTIVLALTVFAGIAGVLSLLFVFGFFYLGLFTIGIIINAIGAIMMAWFAWKEYQAMPKTAAPTPPAPPAPPAA